MKLKTVIVVIAAMTIILGISIVIAASNGNAVRDGHYTWEECDQIAREYLLNSATFQFDGQEETIELSIVMAPSDSDESKFTLTYTFQTGHSGHGDRSGMVILPVITDHRIDITVENGQVTSAICCGVWDEMAGEYLDPGTDAGIMGYVMKIEEGRILVVEPEVQDFSSTGGIDEFYNAIWFSNAPQDIAIGDKVKVWFDFVLDSYPGQSEIEHLEVIPSPKPDGANLHVSEALQKALTSMELNDVVTVVKSIEYNSDAEKKQWVIELKECWGDETHTIEVDDR